MGSFLLNNPAFMIQIFALSYKGGHTHNCTYMYGAPRPTGQTPRSVKNTWAYRVPYLWQLQRITFMFVKVIAPNTELFFIVSGINTSFICLRFIVNNKDMYIQRSNVYLCFANACRCYTYI